MRRVTSHICDCARDRWAAGANHTPFNYVASVPALYLLATQGDFQVLGFGRLSRYCFISTRSEIPTWEGNRLT